MSKVLVKSEDRRRSVEKVMKFWGFETKGGKVKKTFEKDGSFSQGAKRFISAQYKKDTGVYDRKAEHLRQNVNKILPKGFLYNPASSKIVKKETLLTKTGEVRKKFGEKGLVKAQGEIQFTNKNTKIKAIVKFVKTYYKNGVPKPQPEEEQAMEIDYTPNWREALKNKLEADITSGSPNISIDIKSIINISKSYDSRKIIPLADIKLKRLLLTMDGDEPHNWDTGRDQCVTDFLKDYYKDDKNMKNFITDECFDQFFDEGWRENGVSPREIVQNWANNIELSAIALNDSRECFLMCQPDPEVRLSSKSLIFRAHNEHINPVINNTLKMKIVDKVFKKDMALAKKKPKEEKDKAPKFEEIEFVKLEQSKSKDRWEFAFQKMLETKTEILNENIALSYNEGLVSFILNKKKYIFDDERHREMKDFYDFKGLIYEGKNISRVCQEIFDKLELCQSFPNQILNDILNKEGIKHRTHIGGNKINDFIYDHNGEFSDDLIKRHNIHSFDIRKCHSSILNEPIEEWIIFELYDHMEIYTNEEIVHGLYIIDNEEHDLGFGRNIYSSGYIIYALSKSIIKKSDITHYVKASKTLSKDYFKPLFKEFQNFVGGDEDETEKNLLKGLYNTTSGILGKTVIKSVRKHISLSTDETFNYLQENSNKNLFSRNHDFEFEGKPYNFHVYGNKHMIQKSKHNLAIYIQILDQQAIKLHKFKSLVGGEVLYRKVDTIIVKNPREDYTKFLGEKWGDMREQELDGNFKLPQGDYYNVDFDLENSLMDTDWKHIRKIQDSNNFMSGMVELYNQNQGCLIHGDAGSGKSHVLKQFREYVGKDNSITVSFTNFAALNVEGETFHKAFKLNRKCEMSPATLEKMSRIKAIFIDESSTVPSYLWDIVSKIKSRFNTPIYCFVDFKQLKPVQEESKSFKNHPILKMITNSNYATLKYIAGVGRYDDKLYNFCQKYQYVSDFLREGKLQLGRNTDLPMNICFTNKMRKYINNKVMLKQIEFRKLNGEATTDIIDIEKYHKNLKMTPNSGSQVDDMINNKITIQAADWIQNMSFYVGMPLVAMTSAKNLNILNSEPFIIEEIIDLGDSDKTLRGIDKFTLSFKIKSQKRGHTTEITMIQLLNCLVMGYAITCHKAMGSSIDRPFTVWETESQFVDEHWLYTVLTRATKLEYINVA